MKFLERLQNLGFSKYEDYLKSSHWLDFKGRYYRSSNPKECAICGATRTELHHHTYERLGQELFDDVDALCHRCHDLVHEWLERNGLMVQSTRKAINALKPVDHQPKRKKQRSAASIFNQKRTALVSKRSKHLQNQTSEMKNRDPAALQMNPPSTLRRRG